MLASRELSVHRVRGNARIEGERWLVRCLRMKRCWYRWMSAGWVGVCPFVLGNALCVVVCGVRSEYVDVVQVLVVMGLRCVVVRTEHVAGSRDAGVAEFGLCVVVVADLRRTAVAPWGAFNVSGVRWSSGCVVDGLEAVAVLVLSRVTYM